MCEPAPIRLWLVLALVLSACSDPEDLCRDVDCGPGGLCLEADSIPYCRCPEGLISAGTACLPVPEKTYILNLQPQEWDLTRKDGSLSVELVLTRGPEPGPLTVELLDLSGNLVTALAPASVAGIWTGTLSWQLLNSENELSFLKEEVRTLRLEVRDEDQELLDHRELNLRLHCDGAIACNGVCRKDLSVDSRLFDDSPCVPDSCGPDFTPALSCLEHPVAWLWLPENGIKTLLANVKKDVEVNGVFLKDGRCDLVGVELHGGYARTFDKRSLKIKFNREGRYPLDIFTSSPEPPEDPVGFKQLILKAHWVDPSMMRDRLTQQATMLAGGLGPRIVYLNLVLDGRYQGLFAATESILEDFFQRLQLPGSGSLYKAVNHAANFRTKENALDGYEKKEGDLGDSSDLEELLEEIGSSEPEEHDFMEDLTELLDLDLYSSYLLANVIGNNQDAFTKNYYLYKPGDQAFLTVNWDGDATWGRTWEGSLKEFDDLSPWGKTTGLSQALFDNPEFRASYVERFQDLAQGDLSGQALLELVEQNAEELRHDMGFEHCRWSRSASFEAATFDQDLEVIRAFIPKRMEWLNERLR